MSKPPFLSVGKVCLTIYRSSLGQYVDGFYQENTDDESFKLWANVQPLSYHETLLLPEQSRSNKTLKVYSRCNLRTAKEGSWQADEFDWDGDRYRVMKTLSYKMGVLDHSKAICERIEITPDEVIE